MNKIRYDNKTTLYYLPLGHISNIKNILKYLRRTKDMCLVYGSENKLRVMGYVDASFDTDPDD